MRNNEKADENLISPLEWYTTQRKVSELIPCDFNPRQISDAELLKLKNSLERINLVEIQAIDIDNVLLAGHQRIAAMFILERGDEIIDVEFRIENLLKKNLRNICSEAIFTTANLTGVKLRSSFKTLIWKA